MEAREEILTAQGVADILKVSRRKVYDLFMRGELRPRFKLFQNSREGWRWTRADVDAYLESSSYSAPLAIIRHDEAPDFRPIELNNANTD